MIVKNILTRTSLRLPRLAVTAVICWSLGANTPVGAFNSLAVVHVALPEQAAKAAGSPAILSPEDTQAYRAIFAAQEKADWINADVALQKLSDKRLLGHVLADRYERRAASVVELKDWLKAYADLPEASALYEQAQQAALSQKIKIAKPVLVESWTGSDSYGTSFGFRSDRNKGDLSDKARRFDTKISTTLRRGEPNAAKALLEAEQGRGVLSLVEQADLQGRVAAGLFYEGQVDEARALAGEALKSQNPLALWIDGLGAWKQGDALAAGRDFAKLATVADLSAWDRAAASYWAYRALKRSGDATQANYWLKQAALQPHSFYGFMASNLLGRDTAWSWQLPAASDKNSRVLASHPAGARALALIQIGKTDLAESELRHLNPQGKHDLQEAMLALAETTPMPALAVRLGGIATNDNGKPYDAALYPVPPWQPKEGFQVDPTLIYALVRSESRFDPTVVSNRGACGLMQLMPATANLVSNDVVAEDECSGRLLDPSFNMGIGQKYVRHLVNQPGIGDNLVLLLTAYNSGPNKLARWVDNAPKNDPLFFIESLPVRETRDYVQNVMVHYWAYHARMDQPQTAMAQLAHGQWPSAALSDGITRKLAGNGSEGVFRVASGR